MKPGAESAGEITINYSSLTYLCFRQTELGRELDSFRCREVLLYIEPFLQSVKLRITKHGSCFAASNVFRQVVDWVDCRTDHSLTTCSDVM